MQGNFGGNWKLCLKMVGYLVHSGIFDETFYKMCRTAMKESYFSFSNHVIIVQLFPELFFRSTSAISASKLLISSINMSIKEKSNQGIIEVHEEWKKVCESSIYKTLFKCEERKSLTSAFYENNAEVFQNSWPFIALQSKINPLSL